MAHEELFEKLRASSFRRKFRLGPKERAYLRDKGLKKVLDHARKILTERLAPAEPKKDGSQTPMRGHPVFVAQHATGTCCRSCLQKWHGLQKHRELSEAEVNELVEILGEWMQRQTPGENLEGRQLSIFDI